MPARGYRTTTTDERILELFAQADIVLTPEVVALNLTSSERYIERRMDKLAAAGLLGRVDDEYYRLSDEGRAHLNREGSARVPGRAD